MPNPTDDFDLLQGNSNQFYPVVKDYTEPSWSKKSFYFDATNNIFTGNSTISSAINNTITVASAKFTMNVWIRRLATGATQMIFCRDNLSTLVRQFNIAFLATNKLQVEFCTSNTAKIAYSSTNTFIETREWNMFTAVYDGTQSATSRITVYRNGIAEAGTTTQTGTMGDINNTTANNVEIGARSVTANWGNSYINQVAVFNTNLSAAQVLTLFNNRVPMNISESTLQLFLTLFVSADNSAVWTTSWAWTDVVSGGVFTSAGLVEADQVSNAPALKQITVLMLHGQSNATGREPIYKLLSYLRGSLNWCKIWDGSAFVNINSETNNNAFSDTAVLNQYGIEFQLAEFLNRKYQKTIYVFKSSMSGSYLANTAPSWSRNPLGSEFSTLSTNITNMKEWELANGFTITKLRFIWIQGESDSTVLANANAYEASWTNWLS